MSTAFQIDLDNTEVAFCFGNIRGGFMSQHLPEYLRPHEVCIRYGIAKGLLNKLVKAGHLHPITLPLILFGPKAPRPCDRHRRFPVDELERVLGRGAKGSPAR